jgi:hypothetical protein
MDVYVLLLQPFYLGSIMLWQMALCMHQKRHLLKFHFVSLTLTGLPGLQLLDLTMFTPVTSAKPAAFSKQTLVLVIDLNCRKFVF